MEQTASSLDIRELNKNYNRIKTRGNNKKAQQLFVALFEKE
jgi:hypothetical protein